jgi:hypothetical protein
MDTAHQTDRQNPPDVQTAIPNIKKVAAQYHLAGQLEIAGPIEASTILSTPWEFCLKSASEARFKVALFYEGDTFASARQAVIADRCDDQNYKILPN